MEYAYANGNAKQAVSSQVALIEAYNAKLVPAVDQKGEDAEWLHIIAADGKPKALGRGRGHFVVVGEIQHLARTRADFVERLAIIHAKGSFIKEAKPQPDGSRRSSEKHAVLVAMVLDAFEFYETGLSKSQRSAIGKHASSFSPVTKDKDGRMPISEAIETCGLYDAGVPIDEVLVRINRVRKYKVKWNMSYIYDLNKDRKDKNGKLVRARKITLPQRPAGRRTKRI